MIHPGDLKRMATGISALGVACDEFITGGADGSLCLWNLSGVMLGEQRSLGCPGNALLW